MVSVIGLKITRGPFKSDLEHALQRSRDHKDDVKLQSTFSIDSAEKKWMLSSSTCELTKLQALFGKDPKLVGKRDFVTGYTAVHWAAKHGNLAVLTWLCKQGADVNIKSNGGYTPLHLAVIHGKEDAMNALINEYNADINARDHSGRKPRHYLKQETAQWAHRALKATPSVVMMKVDPTANTVADPVKTNVPSQSENGATAINNHSTDEGQVFLPEAKEKRKKRSLSLAASFKHKRRQDRIKSCESSLPATIPLPSPEPKGTPKLRSKSTGITIEHPHFQKDGELSSPNIDEHSSSTDNDLSPMKKGHVESEWKVVTMV